MSGPANRVDTIPQTAKSLPTLTATGEPVALHILVADALVRAPLPKRGSAVIGRGPEADVWVNDPSISRRHAVLRLDEQITLEDLGSSNGTKVMGRTIAAHQPVMVQLGDYLQFGDSSAVLQRDSATAQLCGHGAFEARLRAETERAAHGGSGCSVLRVTVAANDLANLPPDLLPQLLRKDDVLGQYGPAGSYEVLLVNTLADEAVTLRDQVAASFAKHGVRAAVGLANFGVDGRNSEELIATACDRARESTGTTKPLVLHDAAMQAVYDQIDRLAQGKISILLLGETGVGKEVLAQQIHERSRRADKPMMSLNCGAFTPSLLDSELFGHEKGSFTGATRTKPGLLELADGGTLFLDEIGELPVELQVKLLRVMEDQRVLRVGATQPITIDVRVVAATNRQLQDEIECGRFREDLYYRLAGATIVIPPLRARPSEIEPLAQYFARLAGERENLPPCAISDEAFACLRDYRWPGNIRELRNAIERAALLSRGARIEPAHLPLEKMTGAVTAAKEGPVRDETRPVDLTTTVVSDKDVTQDHAARWEALSAPNVDGEREAIIAALNECGGNQRRAAALLGIARGTLNARMARYNIPRPRKS